MAARPRSQDQRLFDRDLLIRGLLQGGGLLLMLIVYHVLLSGAGVSEAGVRTTIFVTLILANLGLIHANRSWTPRGRERRVSANRPFAWIGLSVLLLLAVVLSVEPIRAMFAFAVPGAAVLAVAGLGQQQ
ncbi:hypothetical protein Jab_2c10640 [Janthinobacterium sp. HH01]|uniref:cation transporting ATPase C-terminal domain-containing protein n=1 Tax=Janthinobacterium sp. HH01 TaxID=1198452 RepID=UPI0002AED3C6|nr:cation transporting ATPase C-terminal domain-containing protein [Janthinobacterium sp. HH01]ELX09005.1 hypothetical protein Jab_2c10640 [Janthinobacterium sp. HH01]